MDYGEEVTTAFRERGSTCGLGKARYSYKGQIENWLVQRERERGRDK